MKTITERLLSSVIPNLSQEKYTHPYFCGIFQAKVCFMTDGVLRYIYNIKEASE